MGRSAIARGAPDGFVRRARRVPRIAIRDATTADIDEARAVAAAAIARTAPLLTWNVFPRETPIVRVDGANVVVGASFDTSKTYFLKLATRLGLESVDVVGGDASTTTLHGKHAPEPGDGLVRSAVTSVSAQAPSSGSRGGSCSVTYVFVGRRWTTGKPATMSSWCHIPI